MAADLASWLDTIDDPLAVDPTEAARYVTDDLTAMRVESALVARGLGKVDARRLVKAWRVRTPRTAETLELPEDWATVPHPYVLTPRGVYQLTDGESQQLQRVTTAAVYVAERHIDVVTEEESWALRYWSGDQWHTVDAPRDACQSARKIVDLASRGLPVSSVTASGMVAWLELFAAANAVPCVRTTRQFGWVRKTWVMGDSDIRPASGDPEGVGLLARSCRARGNMAGWLEGLQVAARYPAVMVALGASLASPCLALTDTAGFILSLDGRSSAGKTTAQRFAASVWGCGDELSPIAYLRTWDWTHNSREAWVHALQHLPCIVDDTRRHTGHPDRLTEAVYQMAHGQGRGRMSDGRRAQETRRWRLVTISSGEDAITESSTAGGLRARVIQLWGSPFGGPQADDVAAINTVAKTHYGHAGRAWVASLNSERVELLRERVDALQRQWGAAGEIAGRLTSYAALIGACLWCAAEWLEWPYDGPGLAEWVRPTLTAAIDAVASDADPADRCWEDLLNWLAANPARVERSSGDVVPTEAPAQGYIARTYGSEWVLSTAEVRRWADSMGYRLDAALRQWAADGRLVKREARGLTSYRRIAGTRCLAYTIEVHTCPH